MNTTRIVEIAPNVSVGGNLPFALIAGPCVIEGRDLCRQIAQSVKETCDRLG